MKKTILLSTVAATFLAANANAGALSKRVYKLEQIISIMRVLIKSL